jgi:hypothetical protein
MNEPEKQRFLRKQVISFSKSTDEDVQSFMHACDMKNGLRNKQQTESASLCVKRRNLDDKELIT